MTSPTDRLHLAMARALRYLMDDQLVKARLRGNTLEISLCETIRNQLTDGIGEVEGPSS